MGYIKFLFNLADTAAKNSTERLHWNGQARPTSIFCLWYKLRIYNALVSKPFVVPSEVFLIERNENENCLNKYNLEH